MKIFLATGNKHKIEEIKQIFKNLKNIEILSINDGISIPEVIEDGKTFEENSKKKALEIANFTGMISIADDSGLCVDALDGEPGIYSARYAGENATDKDNNQKLIANMRGINNRKCSFHCAITLAKPNGETHSFFGAVEGELLEAPRGEKGFGYDPYFYLKEYRKTFAELGDEKNKISHRAIALKKLELSLNEILIEF